MNVRLSHYQIQIIWIIQCDLTLRTKEMDKYHIYRDLFEFSWGVQGMQGGVQASIWLRIWLKWVR